MNVNASPTQLSIQVSKRQEIVRSIQDMNRLGLVGDGLDYIQLIENPPPGCDFCQMLRFINHDCCWPAKPQGLFNAISVLSSSWLRPHRTSHHESCLQILLVFDERLVHLQKQPLEMVSPGKTARFRRNCFHTRHS